MQSRRVSLNYLTTVSHSFVGIFWAGDMLTCPLGHYEVGEQGRKNARNDQSGLAFLIATDEYEEWPRSRIVIPRQAIVSCSMLTRKS